MLCLASKKGELRMKFQVTGDVRPPRLVYGSPLGIVLWTVYLENEGITIHPNVEKYSCNITA